MRQAIVIGCHVNGYGAVRSLALEGFRIIAMYYDEQEAFAQASRHVHERVKIPGPRTDEQQFIKFLINNSHRWRDAMIIETNDDVASAIARHKPRLQENYRIAMCDWDILRKLVEKDQTDRIAQQCGVPHPRTFISRTRNDLETIREQIVYPCILKPIVGHLFFAQFSRKAFKVNDYGELTNKFEQTEKAGHEMMIQEIIPGPDSNIYQCAMYVDAQGRAKATFFVRKLRQNPPGFGVARVAISHEPIPQIAQHTLAMLRSIGCTGIIHSEFKKDDRDNRFKLMEINGRLSRSNWLGAFCGINLPCIAYADLGGQISPGISSYRKGVYWIELVEDISNTLFHRNGENLSASDYLKPYWAENKTFADISFDDPLPFLKRLKNRLAPNT